MSIASNENLAALHPRWPARNITAPFLEPNILGNLERVGGLDQPVPDAPGPAPFVRAPIWPDVIGADASHRASIRRVVFARDGGKDWSCPHLDGRRAESSTCDAMRIKSRADFLMETFG